MARLCVSGPMLAVFVATAVGCVENSALELLDVAPGRTPDLWLDISEEPDFGGADMRADFVREPDVHDGGGKLDLADTPDGETDVQEFSEIGFETEVVCQPDCAGKECGPDGCGGSCGVCAPGYACTQGDGGGVCMVYCIEWCHGKECGLAGPQGECPCGDCGESGQQCTEMNCSPENVCEEVPNTGAPCDDGNPCTDSDECDDGECFGELLPPGELVEKECPCETDADCQALEDGDVCNGTLFCADPGGQAAGICQVDAGTILAGTCDDDNPCTHDYCDPVTGCASEDDDGVSCADESFCNGAEVCVQGVCVLGEEIPCDDGDSCTDDSCFEAGQECVHVAVDCDDGNLCTVDACESDKGCVYELLICDDGVECTHGMCDPLTGCFFEGAGDGAVCDSGNPCTLSDYCWMGVCQSAGPADSLCDDGAKCTVDVCSTEDGCVHEPVSCNDGTLCTTDWCDPGTGDCVHQAVDCGDGDVCTVDSCGALTGCVFAPVECEDDNVCTYDDCVPGFGCVFVNEPNGTACGAGYECSSGSCVCQANCTGKECGDDGCGGSCGSCPAYAECVGGSCVAQTCDGWTCAPANYDSNDGCHCDCGCWDPDCDYPSQAVQGCPAEAGCVWPGSCGTPGKKVLCEPCDYNGDCDGGSCLHYPATPEVEFCGQDCSVGPCPPDYFCHDQSSSGDPLFQCAPVSSDCDNL